MKTTIIAAALALVGFSGSAQALTATITELNYSPIPGAFDNVPLIKILGVTVAPTASGTSWDANSSFTFTNTGIETPDYLPSPLPPLSGLTGVIDRVGLGITPPAGDTSTFAFAHGSPTGVNNVFSLTYANPVPYIDFYWGSIDGTLLGSNNLLTIQVKPIIGPVFYDPILGSDILSKFNLNQGDSVWLRISEPLNSKILGFTASSYGSITDSFEFDMAIPEPSTWAMMGIGFAGLAFASRRRLAKAASA